MLHDTLEQQVKLKADIEGFLDTLTGRFGEDVAAIVLACSDCRGWPKPKWKIRKQFFLGSIPAMTPGMVLVSLSDKIHNAQTAWSDYQRDGNTIWVHYKGGHEGTVWYYRALVSAFEARLSLPAWGKNLSGARLKTLQAMLGELDRLVQNLEGTLPPPD
jgi:(p)ppGpp synthase/HD superfamily hydrolase